MVLIQDTIIRIVIVFKSGNIYCLGLCDGNFCVDTHTGARMYLHVSSFGLKLGYYAYWTVRKPEQKKIKKQPLIN